MIHQQIDDFNENTLRNSHIIDEYDSDSKEISEIVTDIFENGIVQKIGFIDDLEGGLAIDYYDKSIEKECRFVMGFTELGCWVYMNDVNE